MSDVRVRLQRDGLLHARIEIGSRVYISQGPPINAQWEVTLDGEWVPSKYPKNVRDEVELNVRFASMQSRRGPDGR